MPPTVLIVDDNPAVRRSVRSLIENSTDWNICGEAEDGAVAVEKAQALAPNIVILDLAMPGMNGLAAARRICTVAPKSLMVMYTLYANEQLTQAAQAAGIRIVVSKATAGDLVKAIRRILPTSVTSDPQASCQASPRQ